MTAIDLSSRAVRRRLTVGAYLTARTVTGAPVWLYHATGKIAPSLLLASLASPYVPLTIAVAIGVLGHLAIGKVTWYRAHPEKRVDWLDVLADLWIGAGAYPAAGAIAGGEWEPALLVWFVGYAMLVWRRWPSP